MAQLKLTKTELRLQQVRLGQLQKYLPTLQLKKGLLQAEVNQSALEVLELTQQWKEKEEDLQTSVNVTPISSNQYILYGFIVILVLMVLYLVLRRR